MITLKKARETGKIDQFMKAHEHDPKGNPDKQDGAIKRLAQGSEKEAPKASSRAASDD